MARERRGAESSVVSMETRFLHTGSFTHRRFYTQTLLHTDAFYTQALLHTEAFTHRRFYTQTLLHTDAFTHRRFYTQTLFTHRLFYTQRLLHTEAFTRRDFYTQTLLRDTFLTPHRVCFDPAEHRSGPRRIFPQQQNALGSSAIVKVSEQTRAAPKPIPPQVPSKGSQVPK